MKNKVYLVLQVATLTISLICSSAFASPSADISYDETDLGSSWQYDYVIDNTSDSGEFLYGLNLYFDTETTLTLPSGWDSSYAGLRR